MSDKQFVGNVKVVETKFGEMIKIGIPEADYVKYMKNGWLNVILKTGQSGKKYLEVDTFEPKSKPYQPTTPEPIDEIDRTGDLPF